MGEAARALDDVSDHLGEVLRRADELLAEWSRFGAQVRTQVDREVAAIGDVVDDAVTRAASAGLDRTIADRLRALTGELERLEQRTRAAARAASERREGDRRVLWIVVAGIVLANALLVALLLRKPDVAPVAEPIRIEAPAELAPPAAPAQDQAPVGSAGTESTESAGGAGGAGIAATTGSVTEAPGSPGAKAAKAAAGSAAEALRAKAAGAGSATEALKATATATGMGSNAPSAGSHAAGAKPGTHAAPNAPAQGPSVPPSGTTTPAESGGPAKVSPVPIVVPPKGGNLRPHKKLP